jgi:hypothetical protein
MVFHLVRQELDGDLAIQGDVLSQENLAHATSTKFLCNVVVRDGLANHGKSLHWQFAHFNQRHLNLSPL